MKIGDYVRTEYGIAKIEEIKPDDKHNTIWYTVDKAQYHCFLVKTQDIIKSSPNILDLIEENDIVNHSRVVCIGVSTDLNGIHKYLVLENGSNCANKNIKSIVTKEQFESMEYRIGK